MAARDSAQDRNSASAEPRPRETAEHEDYSEPVLPGGAASDYERYLNTDDLLSLQKGPGEWVHRDELLFQVTHQSSELWLKLSWNDAAEAAKLIEGGDFRGALRLLERASLCLRFIVAQLDMLERMSPWEYQEIRTVLGHGSGFDSPGWSELRHVLPRLGQAFHAARREAGLSLSQLYVQGRDHEDLYRLAEALIELDEQAQLWRLRHYQTVARVIGDKVVGTQGTPVELLGRLVSKTSFPELWEVRNELTALSKEEAPAES
jgi:tryptophan 2,3-dioxygenase